MAARRKTRGFTLVELMIVVAIIGLLITLLVPAVTKATAIIITIKTKRIIEKEIPLGLEAFRNDFGCYPPSKPYNAADATTGRLPDGASNLVYYLRGPAARGWGTTAGGLMPFGGRGMRVYGPYYEAEESRVVYFPDPDGRVAGFTDAFQPVGLRDNAVVGRILYFRASPGATPLIWTFAWTDNQDPANPDPTKQAFMGYTSAANFASTNSVAGGMKRYLLVSPGFDRRYGLVYKRKETDGGGIVPVTVGTEEGMTCDDIPYAR